MYYYIVDPQKISQKEFERVQNNLYSSLSEYRISGEIVRVTGLRTIQQLVENAFAHEAKTLVAVGTDETLHDVINAVRKRDIVIGFIPLVESEISNILGIKDIPQAVKTVANRRVENLDLGVVNDYYFLSKINFGSLDNNSFTLKFSADDNYQATQEIIGGVILNSRNETKEKTIGNPTDGLLDILLLPKLSKWEAFWYRRLLALGHFEEIPHASVVHVNKIEIMEPLGLALKVGNRVVAKTPATITVVKDFLKMIVGKERNF